jgi:protein gp37
MGDRSAIEWTDATWNPVTGCSHVSEGCRNCYAEALSLRRGWSRKPWTARNAAENVVLRPERLDQPLRWRRPRRVFVNSMSDLFHELVPDDYIDRVFAVMARAWWMGEGGDGRHVFQVLTKRPERALRWFRATASGASRERVVFDTPTPPDGIAWGSTWWRRWPGWPLPNVWLGVSVEDQRAADERIPLLARLPAAVRFLSVEPLLGPVELGTWLWSAMADGGGCAISWVIVGGESGPRSRPMEPAWARAVRDQCVAAGVPFFFKQWGGRTPKAGGRTLDGRLWDQMPEPRAGAISSP